MGHQQNQILPKNVHNRQHILLDNYFDIYKLCPKISPLTNVVKKQKGGLNPESFGHFLICSPKKVI